MSGPASPSGPSGSTVSAVSIPTAAARWRQIAAITAGALALYAGFRVLPTGTNLHHLDFQTQEAGRGGGSLEFCDPANPQFIPVVAVRSPVVTTLVADNPPATGSETRFTLTLATANGKAIGPDDLLVAHTRKLHLMVVDPTLNDYQHLHPEPGERPGEWVFTHTPRLAGGYRVFADFTPVATARGLYASAEFDVPGEVAVNMRIRSWTAEQGGYEFALTPVVDAKGGTGEVLSIRAGRPAELVFTVRRSDGGPVPMGVVMDAYAHLVAFDEARNGFAHLHPKEVDISRAPDPVAPRLTFSITIPKAGLYVIWAQVNLGGEERFVPFWFEVAG